MVCNLAAHAHLKKRHYSDMDSHQNWLFVSVEAK